MKTSEMINEEMVLTLDNTAAGEELISAEDLKEIYGGWQQFTNLYNVPCNVCGRWFAGKTRSKAENLLFWHTLSSEHRRNLKTYGYGRFNERPYWG